MNKPMQEATRVSRYLGLDKVGKAASKAMSARYRNPNLHFDDRDRGKVVDNTLVKAGFGNGAGRVLRPTEVANARKGLIKYVRNPVAEEYNMRLAQEAVFSDRQVNPLQYGEYSKSIQGPQENPQGKIYTQDELRAARNRLHRGTKPQNFFEDTRGIEYGTAQWYAQPWDTGFVRTQTKAPSQPVNEGISSPPKDGRQGALRNTVQYLDRSYTDSKKGIRNQRIRQEIKKNLSKARELPCYTQNEDAFGENVPIEEVSAKAKLAYLRRKLKRRYFKRKPTAVAFQDIIMPADDSLT